MCRRTSSAATGVSCLSVPSTAWTRWAFICKQTCILMQFGHILYAYIFSIWKYKNRKKKEQNQIFWDMFGGLFIFQFAVCPFSTPEYAPFWAFSGTCVSLATSHCCSVSFCIDCIVLSGNGQVSWWAAVISAVLINEAQCLFGLQLNMQDHTASIQESDRCNSE